MGVDIYPPSQPSGMALGYAEILANQSGITAAADITGLSVTVTVPAGRRIRISTDSTLSSTVTTDGADIQICEGATVLQDRSVGLAGNSEVLVHTDVIVLPTAGTHTYKIRASRFAGTGSVTVTAATNKPSYILVEDITGTIYPAGTMVTAGIIASEQWIPYTPTYGNFTLGNGSVASRYMKYGRTVHYRGIVVMGTTSSWSGSITITIPIAAFATDFYYGVAHGDSGSGGGFARTVGLAELSVPVWGNAISLCSTGNSAWTATIPWTWASGYAFGWQITYESLT